MEDVAKLTNYKLRHPIPYYPKELKYQLDNEVEEIKQININLIDDIKKRIKILQEESLTSEIKKSRLNNWDYNAAKAIYNVKNILLDEDIPNNTLVEFMVFHIFDNLKHDDLIEIFKKYIQMI